jgi:hypothetical protein
LLISFITSIDEVEGVTLTDQCPLLPFGSSSSQKKMVMVVVASAKKPFGSSISPRLTYAVICWAANVMRVMFLT